MQDDFETGLCFSGCRKAGRETVGLPGVLSLKAAELLFFFFNFGLAWQGFWGKFGSCCGGGRFFQVGSRFSAVDDGTVVAVLGYDLPLLQSTFCM